MKPSSTDESGREDAEHPRGPVSVCRMASSGAPRRTSSVRRDRDRDDARDEEEGPDDVHEHDSLTDRGGTLRARAPIV